MFKILHVTIITCSYHQKQRAKTNGAEHELRISLVVRIQQVQHFEGWEEVERDGSKHLTGGHHRPASETFLNRVSMAGR